MENNSTAAPRWLAGHSRSWLESSFWRRHDNLARVFKSNSFNVSAWYLIIIVCDDDHPIEIGAGYEETHAKALLAAEDSLEEVERLISLTKDDSAYSIDQNISA